MNEVWKDIPTYEGIYEASNTGKIRTKLGKTTYSKRHGERVWKQRELKQKYKKSRNGKRKDAMVTLWKNKKPHYHVVSRLIASTFIKNNLLTNLTVNHKDGNPLNNSAENLEWLTRIENIKYGFDHEQFKFCKKIVLKSESEKHEFKSQTEASLWLKRSHGYINNLIKSGVKTATDIDGNKYEIIF